MSAETIMAREAAEAPSAVRTQLDLNANLMNELGAELRTLQPRAVVTCARGSSDHAATFAKYLIESRARVLTSSAAPSLTSVYETRPDMQGVLFIAISQSGRSPDLLATAEAAKECGARVVALCNSPESPLANLAHHTVPLSAGKERSVAATKSYIASLSAIVHLVASWAKDRELLNALALAPDMLARAATLDWSEVQSQLTSAKNLYVLGRGYGLGVAQEAALKLKETCGLHAEAFSAAEVKHGPMALVGAAFPVLMFSQSDETRAGVEAIAAEFAKRGANVLLAGGRAEGAIPLPTLDAHPVIEPLLMIQSFYRAAAGLSMARGLNPDAPPHLNKVTETL